MVLMFTNVDSIVQTGGLLAIAFIIFAECGLLIGFFLPGDTLLLAAGLYAGKGNISIGWLLVAIILAAIVGYQVGYYFGERAGPRIFNRKDGFLFREEYLIKTKMYFEKYGAITVLIARFIAHVRTFVSVISGAVKMDKRKFFIYNVIGAVLWGAGVTLLGYWLGANVPDIDHYIIPVIIVALIIFYGAAIWQLIKSPQRRHNLRKGLKEDWNYFFKK